MAEKESKTYKLNIEKLKKLYGNSMTNWFKLVCPALLELNNFSKDISKLFAPSRTLYQDLKDQNMCDNFRNYLFVTLMPEVLEEKIIKEVPPTPAELLASVGYKFYECKSIEEVNSFRQFYRADELICTYNDVEGRFNSSHIFFIVKENVFGCI